MATGDTSDILSRLKSYAPRGWFGDWASAPIISGVLTGIGSVLSIAYTLIMFVRAQTRLQTSVSGWIDLWAYDFLGSSLPRKAGEVDAAYIARIKIAIFQPRGTRPAMAGVLTQLTGRAPIIFEPARPLDSGCYGGADTVTINGTPQIYRTDWQGTQLLYATPRTNLLPWSTNLTLSPWAFAGGIRTLVPGGGPRGIDATLYQGAGSANGPTTISFVATGTTLTVSAYAKAAGDTTNKQFLLRNTTTVTNFDVGQWSPVTGQFISGPGWTSKSVGDGWYLVSYTRSTGFSIGDLMGFYTGTTAAVGPAYALMVAAPQAEPSAMVTSWIPTGAAAVTVTDYTMSSNGAITTGVAPGVGAQLTWTGSYTASNGAPKSFANSVFGLGDGSNTSFRIGAFTQPGPADFYGVARFGSIATPFSCLITAYRAQITGGSAGAAYYDAAAWSAFNTPLANSYFGSLADEVSSATDADILSAINATRPIATNVGVYISN